MIFKLAQGSYPSKVVESFWPLENKCVLSLSNSMTWSSYSIITIIDTFTSLQSVAFGVCVRCKCRAREVNAIVKDDDDGALTCAIKVENEGLACGFCLFSSFRRLVEELPRRGVSLQWKVGKARLSISFCRQKNEA